MPGLERLIGEVLDDKYRLERLLGQGGMGAVYLATHLGTERPVALKLIAPQFMRNAEFVERFKREARAAGRLRHPNVVDVTDFGFAETGRERVAYLVMEYLDGCTLADVLAEEKRLPLTWVVDILEQVCSAVDEAHQQGIVHRDLKPDNIWLEPTRLGGYRVKVLDFGIAKLGEAGFDEDTEIPRPEVDPLPAPPAPPTPAESQFEGVQALLSRAAAALHSGANQTGEQPPPASRADANQPAASQTDAPGSDAQRPDAATLREEAATQIYAAPARPHAPPEAAPPSEAVTRISHPPANDFKSAAPRADDPEEQGTRIFEPSPAAAPRPGAHSIDARARTANSGEGAHARSDSFQQSHARRADGSVLQQDDESVVRRGDASVAQWDDEPGARQDEAGERQDDAGGRRDEAGGPRAQATGLAQPHARETAAHEQSPRLTRHADEADRTRMLDAAQNSLPRPQGTHARGSTDAGQTAALTRVGSIMGTPLYMSPEQCRGERLGPRSDIYSMGVIAYQMLAGETPFTGDVNSVMRQHAEAQPPPLRARNKEVGKRVERVIFAALAKNPAERPPTAASFASALRANSAGIGTLLRRAFALYSEHLPTFLRLTFIAHIPVFLTTALLFAFEVAEARGVRWGWVGVALMLCAGLLQTVASFISNSVISGVTAVIVTQLQLAPLRPVSLRPAFEVLRRRWRPFLRTSIGVTLRMFVGFLLLFLPGLWLMVKYALYAPVVLLEGLSKKAARQRANELSRRSRRTVIGLILINMALPVIIAAVVGGLSVGAEIPTRDGPSGVSVSPRGNQSGVRIVRTGEDEGTQTGEGEGAQQAGERADAPAGQDAKTGEGSSAQTGAGAQSNAGAQSGGAQTGGGGGQIGVRRTGKRQVSLWQKAVSHFVSLMNIFIVPLISITTALLYLKMRLMGGETMRETLAQFEEVDPPRARWQQRMRSRLSVRTPQGRTRSD